MMANGRKCFFSSLSPFLTHCDIFEYYCFSCVLCWNEITKTSPEDSLSLSLSHEIERKRESCRQMKVKVQVNDAKGNMFFRSKEGDSVQLKADPPDSPCVTRVPNTKEELQSLYLCWATGSHSRESGRRGDDTKHTERQGGGKPRQMKR